MALSRTSRYALLFWIVAKIGLVSCVLRQDMMVERPFWQAVKDFDEAYNRHDLKGMREALARQKAANCASWFRTEADCPP